MDQVFDAFSIAQQQQELMAAETLESDLELAFRIQMQEALDASLLHQQPSTSSYLSHRQSVPNTAFGNSSVSLEAKLSEGDADVGISSVMKLQSTELERFQQERKDNEIFEAEMRRIVINLKLREHDETFAREIDGMSDNEWEERGDYFEMPVDTGCSSSGGTKLSTGEPFRLYFKGLMSNEWVERRFVPVAAIGIALCDPQCRLLLEIKKPLSEAGMSRAVVEAKALIEGLSTVLSLDIKKIDVFFDCITLYKHVTGRWKIKQKKIMNLINEVHSLQGKLESCKYFLLPRYEVKFAFKLAREAIESQLTRKVQTNDTKETCAICSEDTDISQMFVVDGCFHRYCFSCMKQHVEVKLLQGLLPGCPNDGCPTKLLIDSSKKFLPPRLSEIMKQREIEASIPEMDRLYCPYPRCSVLMSLKEIMHRQEESSSTSDKTGRRKCLKCNGFFCINCKVPWHGSMSCADYMKFNPCANTEDGKLKFLARQKLWRQCFKCKNMIELAEGCYHMTCRCGYEFCYTCGAQWIKKKATCSCPLWDEENIWPGSEDDSDDFNGDFDDNEDYESDEFEFYPRRQNYVVDNHFRRL